MRIFIFLLLAAGLFMGLKIDMSLAQEVTPDTQLYCETASLISGSVGNLIGIVIALSGLLTFLKGSPFGIVLMIIGAGVVFVPQMFTNFLGGMDKAFSGSRSDTRGNSNDFNVQC